MTGFPSHSRGKVQVLTKVHKAYLAVCPAYHSMLSSCSLLLSSCSLLLADSTLATSDSPDLLPLQVLCPYLCLCLGCSHPAPASSSAAPSLPQVFIHIPPSADVLAPPLCSTVMTPPPADIWSLSSLNCFTPGKSATTIRQTLKLTFLRGLLSHLLPQWRLRLFLFIHC